MSLLQFTQRGQTVVKIRIEISPLTQENLSGVGNYTKDLATSLAQQAGVTLCGSYFSFLRRKTLPALPANIILEEKAFFPLKIYAKIDSLGLLRIPFDLSSSKVDLTIFPNFSSWKSIHSKKTATVIHDLAFLKYPEYLEKKNLAHLQRVVPRAIRESDYIITVSETVRQEIIQEYNIKPSTVIVTPIPPNKNILSQSPDVDIHARYKIPTKKYFFFLGNLEPRKNLLNLVRAYNLLPSETQQEYSLVIAGGKGWNFQDTQKEIDAANNPHIRQIGYADQAHLRSLYTQSMLYIQPSIYEGFGMPVLEALSCGTQVLVSDIPVLREAGGDAVHFTPPNNPQEMAKDIVNALASPIDTQTIEQHLARFSWDENCRRILELI